MVTQKRAGQRQGTPPPPTAAPSPRQGGSTRVALPTPVLWEPPQPRFQGAWALSWCQPSKPTFLKRARAGTAREGHS